MSIALRRVLLTLEGEGLRELAEVAVEDTFEGGEPSCRELSSIRSLDDRIQVSLHTCFHFAVAIELGTVVETWKHRLWHCSVVLEYIEYIVEGTTLSEVELAVQTDVLACLITIGMADDKHFGEVIFTLTDTNQFVFEEALSRVGPAGT